MPSFPNRPLTILLCLLWIATALLVGHYSHAFSAQEYVSVALGALALIVPGIVLVHTHALSNLRIKMLLALFPIHALVLLVPAFQAGQALWTLVLAWTALLWVPMAWEYRLRAWWSGVVTSEDLQRWVDRNQTTLREIYTAHTLDERNVHIHHLSLGRYAIGAKLSIDTTSLETQECLNSITLTHRNHAITTEQQRNALEALDTDLHRTFGAKAFAPQELTYTHTPSSSAHSKLAHHTAQRHILPNSLFAQAPTAQPRPLAFVRTITTITTLMLLAITVLITSIVSHNAERTAAIAAHTAHIRTLMHTTPSTTLDITTMRSVNADAISARAYLDPSKPNHPFVVCTTSVDGIHTHLVGRKVGHPTLQPLATSYARALNAANPCHSLPNP